MSTTLQAKATGLSILDLVPIPAGKTSGDAISASLDLAVRAEELGYLGYWFGEHHLGRGRSGAAPTVLAALVASRTERIRVGSAVAVLPNYSPLQLVEQFSTIASVYPGRVAIGIGRGNKYTGITATEAVRRAVEQLRRSPLSGESRERIELELGEYWSLQKTLLRVDEFDDAGFEGSVYELLALLEHEIAYVEGIGLHAAPGFGAEASTWLFGWTAGPSARLAGALGLPYVANAHNHGFPIAENVAHYREHFTPSRHLAKPYVAVSTHALVAETQREAAHLGTAYAEWIDNLRRRNFADFVGQPGAEYFPRSDDDRAAVENALSLRFVGEPDDVAQSIRALADVAGADEVIVHTMTHDSASRQRSYELLGEAWALSRLSLEPVSIA